MLTYREQDDKSKYLAQAGFTQANPDQLKQAILDLIQTHEAIKDNENEYGTFYRVTGNLTGTKKELSVITIWLQRKIDQQIQFITLKPNKQKSS